jgi:hypothetical protein
MTGQSRQPIALSSANPTGGEHRSHQLQKQPNFLD